VPHYKRRLAGRTAMLPSNFLGNNAIYKVVISLILQRSRDRTTTCWTTTSYTTWPYLARASCCRTPRRSSYRERNTTLHSYMNASAPLVMTRNSSGNILRQLIKSPQLLTTTDMVIVKKEKMRLYNNPYNQRSRM